jgi:hypothetical protein
LKLFGSFLGSIFALALLAALLAGGYFLFKYVVGVFATLDPQVETLAAIASVISLLCAVIIAEGLKARGQKDSFSIATAEKTKTYQRLLYLCSERLRSQLPENRQVVDAELAKIEHLLALHGGARVVSAYVKLRRPAQDEGKTGGASLLNKLLMEMRRDLGHSEFIRNERDFLELLLPRS